MMTRALSSATAGLAVTTALFYVMQLLIETGEDILTDPPVRHVLDWIDPIDPPDSPVEPEPPARIDDPEPPPPTVPVDFSSGESDGFHIPAPPPGPPVGKQTMSGYAFTDNSLINLYRVYPQFPATAASRGLEGAVIVRFDVTATGSVANAHIVETTNGIFNKSAIQAAYKFRYRPRVVDGIPYGSEGLQQLFTFRMEK
jgi:protein TonB